RARLRTSTVQLNPVVFGTLARASGLSPSYSAGSCLNTYCHGATLVGGSNKSPQWGQIGYLQGCGTCHGFPPANTSHNNVTSATLCSGCHPHVNSSNSGFTAAGVSLHINGILEAVGGHGGAPYFGHNTAAAPSCLKANGGCHNIGNGTTLYPLVKDPETGAPDCMSCHALADPLVAGNGLGNCKSCHGTGGTGTLAAPTGTTWPNIRGSNASARHPSHQGSTCGTCHTGVDITGRTLTGAAGSGSGVNHGPNKNKLLGTTQTNSTQTVTGIVPKAARGTGSTCSHGSIPAKSCHGGPGTQTWTAP